MGEPDVATLGECECTVCAPGCRDSRELARAIDEAELLIREPVANLDQIVLNRRDP